MIRRHLQTKVKLKLFLSFPFSFQQKKKTFYVKHSFRKGNMPPFESLPFWYQTMLIVFSVITLVVGGSVFWRMLKSVFGKDDEKK